MIRHIIKSWLPLAIASTIILLTVYTVVQQSIRTEANDPQIQMAEDTAVILATSSALQAVIGTSKIDMERSLAPFAIVYDDSGKVLASSGFLQGQVPVLPSGVFDYARKNRDDRLTWQPSPNARIAAVVKHFGGKTPGFIVAGRNMREVEYREKQVLLIVVSAWIGLLILTLLAVIYAFVSEQKVVEIDIE